MVEDEPLRSEVAESWMRSAAAGVGSEQTETVITLTGDLLREARRAHPLAAVLPLLEDVLGNAASACDAIMAVSDAEGQLLWVQGSRTALGRAESIGFVPGSSWHERDAGTNAPGLVVATDAAVEITRTEHFRQAVRTWSCVAAPIHDPVTHSLLGVLDITGGIEIEVPQTMAMVRAAARLAEAELARTLEPAGPAAMTSSRITVSALGRSEALVRLSPAAVAGPVGRPTTLRMSPRHSEIVALLVDHPGGLTGDQLAVRLYETDVSATTLRVELGRLRALLGEELASRPYRLLHAGADWLRVEALIAAGDLGAALRAYGGPLLPRSLAPGVVEIRDRVHFGLRRAVLTAGHPDLMSHWTRSSWGTDDVEVWLALRAALQGHSPLMAIVDAQLGRLDR